MHHIPLDQITYRNLVAFYYAASSSSLQEAARCLEQPVREIAMMIRQLEDKHCMKLIAFSDTSASLTEDGEQFLKTIGPHLLGLSAALSSVEKGWILPDGRIVWNRGNET